MFRTLAATLFTCLIAATGFAQSTFNGKWTTDQPDPLAAAFQIKGGSSLSLEIVVKGEKASGTLGIGGLGGDFYKFDDAKLNENRFRFETVKNGTTAVWTAELVAENTIRVSHYLALISNVLDLLSLPPATQQQEITPPANPTPVGTTAPASPDGDVGVSSILYRAK